MTSQPGWLWVVVPLACLGLLSVAWEMRRQRQVARGLAAARKLGVDEPLGYHPAIDPLRCLGCGGCVKACPEHGVLQLFEGRAHLVNGAHCVGHGRCKDVCPTEAIELVLGTPKRPLQVPVLDAQLQSSVRGLYVAGELGGMGLIRNALHQGQTAVGAIARGMRPDRSAERVDVAIVGSGPAGLAAGLACREHGFGHVILDQDGLGGSVNHYPRQKLVMTEPVQLPVIGRMHFREVHKEELLEYWQGVVARASLDIRAPVRVLHIQRRTDDFELETSGGPLRARRVVLAVGRRGTPRKLGVPGEESSKVVYRLLEPERYRGQHVLVVGGGNSAVEAAVALAEEGAHTTLSYRGKVFKRVLQANQARLEAAQGPHLTLELESNVHCIEPDRVLLATPRGNVWLPNQVVIVLIGGQLPTAFLQRIGIQLAEYQGEAMGHGRTLHAGRTA